MIRGEFRIEGRGRRVGQQIDTDDTDEWGGQARPAVAFRAGFVLGVWPLMKDQGTGQRLWVSVAGAFLLAFVVAVFGAPYLFNGLISLGRALSAAEFLRDVEFEKVFTRTFVITLLLSFAFLSAMRGGAWEGIGFRRDPRWGRRLLAGFGLGALTMLAVYLIGCLAGAYRPVSGLGGGVVVSALALALVGALLVGFIEESVFRGGLFGALRGVLGVPAAAAISSFIFAVLHFAEPIPSAGVVRGYWHSGLKIVPDLFRGLLTGVDVQPFILTVFVMALVLCLFFQRQGSIYFIIGLHAGWVWVIAGGGVLLEAVGEPGVFLRDPAGAPRSYLALLVMLIFALAAGWRRRERGA